MSRASQKLQLELRRLEERWADTITRQLTNSFFPGTDPSWSCPRLGTDCELLVNYFQRQVKKGLVPWRLEALFPADLDLLLKSAHTVNPHAPKSIHHCSPGE